MQQVNYSGLDIQKEAQGIPQNFSSQKLNDKSLQLEILEDQKQCCQQHNALYQPILIYQNQVDPYSSTSPPIQSDQNALLPSTIILVKDLDFHEQKGFLIRIALLFHLWSAIYGILLTLLLNIFSQSRHQCIYFCLFTFFFIVMIILNKISIQKTYRKSSGLFYFFTILLYTLAYFSIINSCFTGNHKENTILVRISIGIFIYQCTNVLTTVVMVFYLLVEQQKINIGKFMGFSLLVFAILSLIFLKQNYLILLIIPFSIPYSFLLPNSLLQIAKGRFSLEKNEVFTGVQAANFGLYVCCTQEEQL